MLSQNFLMDTNITSRIVQSAGKNRLLQLSLGLKLFIFKLAFPFYSHNCLHKDRLNIIKLPMYSA